LGCGGAGFAHRRSPTGGAAKRMFLKMYLRRRFPSASASSTARSQSHRLQNLHIVRGTMARRPVRRVRERQDRQRRRPLLIIVQTKRERGAQTQRAAEIKQSQKARPRRRRRRERHHACFPVVPSPLPTTSPAQKARDTQNDKRSNIQKPPKSSVRPPTHTHTSRTRKGLKTTEEVIPSCTCTKPGKSQVISISNPPPPKKKTKKKPTTHNLPLNP
jgi:hypothetical protein